MKCVKINLAITVAFVLVALMQVVVCFAVFGLDPSDPVDKGWVVVSICVWWLVWIWSLFRWPSVHHRSSAFVSMVLLGSYALLTVAGFFIIRLLVEVGWI
jgi:hypothetical protein